MTAYRELIERLEKATGPDREIDASLMGLGHFRDKRHVGAYYDDNTPALDDVWVDRVTNKWRSTSAFEFTASIDAALSLVEKMLPGHNVSFIAYARGGASAALEAVDVERLQFVGELGPTPALAILTCLLRALEAQSKDKEEGE